MKLNTTKSFKQESIPDISGSDPGFTDVVVEWREKMGLGKSWKKEMVNKIIDVEYYEKEIDGKKETFEQCFLGATKTMCAEW